MVLSGDVVKGSYRHAVILYTFYLGGDGFLFAGGNMFRLLLRPGGVLASRLVSSGPAAAAGSGVTITRGISHVHVKCQGKLVVVKSEAVDEDTLQKAVNSRPFTDWLSRMNPLKEHMMLRRIDVQAVDMFRTNVGFIKFVAEVTDADGDPCPGAVFMRGGSVAVLVSPPTFLPLIGGVVVHGITPFFCGSQSCVLGRLERSSRC